MINHPDQDLQGVRPPSGKLILPAPPELKPSQVNPQTIPIWPYQEAMHPQPAPYSQAAPRGLVARWRKEPVYLVLSIAVALVLLATVFLVAFGTTTLIANNGLAYSQTPSAPAVNGTVDHKPTLPTPATGQGSSQSSQPATGPTPDLQQTTQGPLSVQITNLPDVVRNNSKVQVNVVTSEPGVQVKLRVTYSSSPFPYTGGTHTTNDNGQASLSWTVRTYSFGGSSQAMVEVIATDQNGQQATSQPVTVTIEG